MAARQYTEGRVEYALRSLSLSPGRMTVVLIGSTGNGKSTLGNFLLDPSEEHILDDPTFEPGTTNKPETKYVTVASEGDLTVVDTPGLNESDHEDFKHMTAIVKQLNELQSISACILCVKFDSKIDSQYKTTVEYYKRLLPQLFENNVLVVLTNYCTDEKSKYQRKRQNIREETSVENTLGEVSKGLLYPPGCFLIDALPLSEKERSEHEETRSSILEFARKLKPVYVHKSLKVAKTAAVIARDKEEIEKVKGEIKGYEEAIQKSKGQNKEVYGQVTIDLLQIRDANQRFESLKADVEKLDSTELETAFVWNLDEKWKWFQSQSREHTVISHWPIAEYIWWDNGKLEGKELRRDKYSVSVAIKGRFMAGLHVMLTVKVKKCDKYENEIKALRDNMLALKQQVATSRVSLNDKKEKNKELEMDILKLESFVNERNATIKKLEENSMTVKEVEELIKKLYL